MPSNALTALIVDDERLARRELARLLEEFADRITVIGEASNKREAVEFLNNPPNNIRPDVVFLDINMPHGSGFSVLDEVGHGTDEGNDFSIVFVTAYDEFALRAFAVNALDYVLKPLDPDRLEHTIERLWKVHRKEQLPIVHAPAPQTQSREPSSDPSLLTPEDYVFVTFGKQRRFVQVEEIMCITASDNYTELWLPDGGNATKRAMLLRTMNEWEAILPEQYFQRIHRSTIISLAFVDASYPIETTANGAFVLLRGIAEPFAISRRYFSKLKERF